MKILKKIGKIALITLISLVGVIVLALGGLNLVKFGIYSDYYKIKTNVCINPGLGDNFVCQGIAASEENEVIFVCGYMKDDTNSRIYVTNEKNESYYVNLVKNGKKFTGHAGGMATTNDKVYIANGGRIYIVDINDILNASKGDEVEIGEGIKVSVAASFAYTDEEYLYVGEFHNGAAYNIEGHENETKEGTHYAITLKYDLDDLTKPIKAYSIRNKVQGICFTPDGKVVMSTSYGLADSIYYVYNESEASNANKEFEGAPLYYLDTLVNEIHGPAMSEDLDYYNGKVITLTESASNKYIFGKFFFANKIIALEI